MITNIGLATSGREAGGLNLVVDPPEIIEGSRLVEEEVEGSDTGLEGIPVAAVFWGGDSGMWSEEDEMEKKLFLKKLLFSVRGI